MPGSRNHGSPFLLMIGVTIPLPLAVNAAAILLAVQIHRLGNMAAIGIAFTKVGVKKRYALL